VNADPTTTGHFLAGNRAARRDGGLDAYDDRGNTFLSGWAQPQGLADGVNAVLDKWATNIAMVVVFAISETASSMTKHGGRMRLIVPHIRRAVLIEERSI